MYLMYFFYRIDQRADSVSNVIFMQIGVITDVYALHRFGTIKERSNNKKNKKFITIVLNIIY